MSFAGCKGKTAVVKPAAKTEAKKSAAPVAVQAEAPKVEKEVFVYDPKGRRDPFLSLVPTTQAKAERKTGATPIEHYDVEELRVIAIAWDSRQYYAVVTLPDNKSYTVRKGMTLGLNSGKITGITKDFVFIKEQIKDYKGQLKTKDTILRLRKEEGE